MHHRIKGSYSVPLAMIRKYQFRRRNHDASDDPFLDKPFFDDTRINNTVQRSYEEYVLARKAQAIIENQQPHGMWLLDRESRKKEAAKQLAEWNTEER